MVEHSVYELPFRFCHSSAYEMKYFFNPRRKQRNDVFSYTLCAPRRSCGLGFVMVLKLGYKGKKG